MSANTKDILQKILYVLIACAGIMVSGFYIDDRVEAKIKCETARIETEVVELKKMQSSIQDSRLTLARIEEKVTALSQRLDDIAEGRIKTKLKP